MTKAQLSFLPTGLLLLLTACTPPNTTPPSLAITTPASGSPVSGTVPVQVSTAEEDSVTRIDLYVRGKGSTDKGVPAGSAVASPFVISWNTTAQPNAAELELVAVGVNKGGNEAESPPVAVKTQNSNVPTLQLLTAFTIPPDSTVGAASVGSAELPSSVAALATAGVRPPADLDLAQAQSLANSALESLTSQPTALEPQQTERDLILEWQWAPYAAGADGYGVYLSSGDLAGPYEVQVKQAASAGTGAQKYSKPVEGAKAGSSYHGLITAVTNGASAETGFSNADKATFLPAQSSTSPADGAQVAGGRPSFTWTATPGAVGYLYYAFDKNPWERDAKLLWSNFPNSVSTLSASYPADRTPLPSGSYSWWVAGVSFDPTGKADGFTFSEPKRFDVP